MYKFLNIKKNLLIIFSFLFFFITSCDFLSDQSKKYLANDQEHEGKMLKNALSDFWSFTVETGSKSNSDNNTKIPKVIWSIKNMSEGKRLRAFVEADSDISTPDKLLQRKAFRLAKFVLIETKADVVKIRLWTKDFRHFGGVFAYLVMAKDGLSWSGKQNDEDIVFKYTPKIKLWKKLSTKDLKVLKTIEQSYIKLKVKTDISKKQAIRNAGATLGISPDKLYKFVRKVRKYFKHPKI